MRSKVLLILLIILWRSGYAYSQETETLNLNLGFGLAQGHSKIDHLSLLYRAPIVIPEINATFTKVRIRSRFVWGWERFGGKSADIEIESKIFGIKTIRFGVNTRYFYAYDEDVVWDYNHLLVTGQTQKQYLLAGFNAGIGDYRHKNFQVYYLVGGTDILQKIFVYTDNRELKGSPVKYNEDILAFLAGGASMTWPDIWQKMDIHTSVLNIQTQNYFRRSNQGGAVPKNQWLIESEFKYPINLWLDAGFDLRWNSQENGMIHLGNSGAIKAVFKF